MRPAARSAAALVVALAAVSGAAACVDVPDSMRAQFAPPGPADRSNYRPGPHGSAPAVEAAPPPPAPVAGDAGASSGHAVPDAPAPDASAPATPVADASADASSGGDAG